MTMDSFLHLGVAMFRKLSILVLLAFLMVGCAGASVTNEGDTPLSILQGNTKRKHNFIAADAARQLDVTTPIVLAREKGAAKLDKYQTGYTGRLNGHALAVMMRKVLADDVLFANALMSSGPGDCAACRQVAAMRNASYLSLKMPSVNYSKIVTAEGESDFVAQASVILEEVSNAAVEQGCVAVPGHKQFLTSVPMSDGENYLVVQFACPVPESMRVLTLQLPFGSFGQGSMVSHLVGVTKKGLGVPMISEVLVINRDKDVANTVRASITSTCAVSFDIAAKKGAKLSSTDWDLCKDNTLPLRKEDGWAELTTSVIQDKAALSVIEIDSASWSGVVPSPVQPKAQAEM
jgi:hypothetical protein